MPSRSQSASAPFTSLWNPQSQLWGPIMNAQQQQQRVCGSGATVTSPKRQALQATAAHASSSSIATQKIRNSNSASELLAGIASATPVMEKKSFSATNNNSSSVNYSSLSPVDNNNSNQHQQQQRAASQLRQQENIPSSHWYPPNTQKQSSLLNSHSDSHSQGSPDFKHQNRNHSRVIEMDSSRQASSATVPGGDTRRMATGSCFDMNHQGTSSSSLNHFNYPFSSSNYQGPSHQQQHHHHHQNQNQNNFNMPHQETDLVTASHHQSSNQNHIFRGAFRQLHHHNSNRTAPAQSRGSMTQHSQQVYQNHYMPSSQQSEAMHRARDYSTTDPYSFQQQNQFCANPLSLNSTINSFAQSAYHQEEAENHTPSPSSLSSSTKENIDSLQPHSLIVGKLASIMSSGTASSSERTTLLPPLSPFSISSNNIVNDNPGQHDLTKYVLNSWCEHLFQFIHQLPEFDVLCKLSQEERYYRICSTSRPITPVSIPSTVSFLSKTSPPKPLSIYASANKLIVNLQVLLQRLSVSSSEKKWEPKSSAEITLSTPYAKLCEFEHDLDRFSFNMNKCYSHCTDILCKVSRLKQQIEELVDMLKAEHLQVQMRMEKSSDPLSKKEKIICPPWREIDEKYESYFQWDDDVDVSVSEKKHSPQQKNPSHAGKNEEWSDTQMLRAHKRNERLERFRRLGGEVRIKKHSYDADDSMLQSSDSRGNYEDMKARIYQHYFCQPSNDDEDDAMDDDPPKEKYVEEDITNLCETSPAVGSPVSLHDNESTLIPESTNSETDDAMEDDQSTDTSKDGDCPEDPLQVEDASSETQEHSPRSSRRLRKRKRSASTKDQSSSSAVQKATKKQKKDKTMSFLEAAITLLREVKAPRTAKELVDEILQRGMVQSRGRTPHHTLAARCYTYIRDCKEKSAHCEIRKIKPGIFAINEEEYEEVANDKKKSSSKKKRSSGKKSRKTRIVQRKR